MLITPLDTNNQRFALDFVRRSPYRNALPLSNITQLRAQCDVLVAEEAGRVVGVTSTYHSLPIANLTFVVDHTETLGALLDELARRNPRLRAAPGYALLPAERLRQLAQFAQILEAPIEYQMVIEPETLRKLDGPAAQRLTADHIPQMDALAAAAGLTVWHSSALELGPAFGCFADGQLVAMAATHFATADVVEIGHVATHPQYRRRGFALACTAALTQAAFRLAPRVFLMVLDDNAAALATYKRLGFHVMERFHLTRFALA